MKTELAIGQRWIVKEEDHLGIIDPDAFFIMKIIYKIKNYKKENRWIAFKFVPKKYKFDIKTSNSSIVVFDDNGVEQQWDFIYNARKCWYKLIELKKRNLD